ncbi:hypothetical protein F4809DRAFT_645235 [Biscogniauxia mediterranea]|nr:hypothetical protein F4809DRAFT_645235 [Biscogniauxia mediterranea]
MGSNALTMRSGGDDIIDLTVDDDEDASGVQDSVVSKALPITTRFTPASSQPPPPVQPPNSQAATNGFIHHPPDQTPEPQQERPAKRRRTEENTALDRAALQRCLEAQVFPYIDAATARLDSAIYNVNKLGATVIRQTIDKSFERYFREGNGRIPGDVEALISVRVYKRVTELTADPAFRRTPPAPVLPSIEDRVEEDEEEEVEEDEDDDDDEEEEEEEEEQQQQQQQRQQENNEEDGEEQNVDVDVKEESKDGNGANNVDIDNYHDDDDFDDDDHRPNTHTPPPSRPKAADPITPQRLRARAKASRWQSGRAYESKRESSPVEVQNQWFKLSARPYLRACVRQAFISNPHLGSLLGSTELPHPGAFHVDFNDFEVRYIQKIARALYGKPAIKGRRSTMHDIRHLLKKVPHINLRIEDAHTKGYTGYDPPPRYLMRRTVEDIHCFLGDLYDKKLSSEAKTLFVERDDDNIVARSDIARANKVPALLLTREIAGNRPGLSTARSYHNFTTAFKSNKEDYLEPKVEWTNCAGDLMTMSWLSNKHFVCGTTTHSDSHNQQYNKPGNLLLGSAASNTLRAYPDHRVVRPIVAHGDNAQESMRESQDPWLYTSVVSSDYEPSTGLAFTSSFDKTVKIWKLDGDSMRAVGTWEHSGRVNFVVASKDRTIATAADVPTEAVRVYHLNSSEDVSSCQFDSYSCTRVHDEDYVPSEKWAYFPAAIRWGLAPVVQHLLLIGYSPRSVKGEDHEIPVEKRDTGELCLWNTITKTQVKVNSAKTQNVFEVAWHPTRGSFIAATSASQTSEKLEEHIQTQIRIFEPNPETGQYGAIKTLDCAAIDINELSIRPNSTLYSYVTASCTDGKVYVWDTAASDQPMCILEHGDPVEELLGDREQEDVGVKFTAWGTTADRLYTGSSDGVVKVWNIRHGKGAHIKDLIEVAAPITVGAFSPDFTKLAIGDGSGRVYLLALDEGEDAAAISSDFLKLQLNGTQRVIRRPRPFIPHAELPPPPEYPTSTSTSTSPGPGRLAAGQARARAYLQNAELERHADATIGVVQGANYARTGLFRAEAHLDGDAAGPLLSAFENQQRANQHFARTQRFPRQGQVMWYDDDDSEGVGDGVGYGEKAWAYRDFHDRNAAELDLADVLDEETGRALRSEGAEIEARPEDLDYEEGFGGWGCEDDEDGDGDEDEGDWKNDTCNLS